MQINAVLYCKQKANDMQQANKIKEERKKAGKEKKKKRKNIPCVDNSSLYGLSFKNTGPERSFL